MQQQMLKKVFIFWRYSDVSLSLYDILCCGMWFLLLHPQWPPLSLTHLHPSPPLVGRLKAKAEESNQSANLCSHSDAGSWATAVAESGWLEACIDVVLFWDWSWSLLGYDINSSGGLYNVCWDLKGCCSKLFHHNIVLKQADCKQALWMCKLPLC